MDQDKLKELLEEGEKLHLLEEAKSITNIKEKWFVEDETDDEKTDKATNETLPNDKIGEAEHTSQLKNNDDPEDTKILDAKSNEEPKIDSEKEPTNEASSDKAKTKSRKSKWSKSKISQERMYNLDLMPRLLYSRGSMVELLIQSNISRYTEFKAVSRVLTILNGVLEHVPSSRADVFGTRHISVIEKRILMKFLEFCLNYEDENNSKFYENYQQRPFVDFLKHQKLTENLIHFVLNSIAMVNKNTNTLEGLKATQKFLSGLGRFGNTPFLYSSFGSGELPQAFCRLCAVFGGTYFLGRNIEGVFTDANDKCLGIISNGQKIHCQKLVLSGQSCPVSLKQQKPKATEMIYRKIRLTCDSILRSEKEQLTFLSIPNQDNDFTFVTEVGHGASVCPKSMYCLHLTSNQDSIDENLENLIEEICLWSLDFEISNKMFEVTNNETLYLTSGPHFELDYDQTIENAKNIYKNMYPEEPFLPRAPDPDEIILDYPTESNEEINNEKCDEEKTVENADESKN